MKNRRILIRSGSLRMGGLERILIEVLQGVDKNKFDIHLLIDDDSGKLDVFKKDIPKEIPFQLLKSAKFMDKITISRNKKNKKFLHKVKYNFLMWQARKICLNHTLLYIQEHGPFDVIVDYDAGASRYMDKIPIPCKIVWIHNSIPQLLKKKSKILHFARRLENYDVIVAICDEMKKDLQQLFPKVSGRITRIYNPFCFERIESLGKDGKGLTLGQKKLLEESYCVMVSRLDSVQKDYDTLLKAYQIVKKSGIQDRLYIIGDGPDKKNIETKIKQMGLENSVYLLGFTKNPYIWIKNSKFLVHSSHYEGLPTVLIESLILNKPLVSSSCPTGPKEILDNENCGKLFPVGDFQKLSDHLISFLSSEKERIQYEDYITTSKSRFEQKKIIREYEHLLENISPGVLYEKN